MFLSWKSTNLKFNRKGRLPVVVMLSACVPIVSLVFAVTTYVDVSNVYNGFPWMLMSLTLLPYYITTTIVYLRMVRLGERIIPLARDLGVGTENHGLRKQTKVTKILLAVQLASAVASTIVLCVLGPLDPQNSAIHGTVGLALKAQFQFCVLVGLTYQYYRCIQVVRTMQQRAAEIKSPVSKESERTNNLKQSIRTMQQRMFLTSVVNVFTTGQFILVSAYVIPRTIWWVYYYQQVLETFFMVLMEFSVICRKSNKRNGAIVSNSKNSTPQVVVAAAEENATSLTSSGLIPAGVEESK
jgi:hypothetical protein